MKYLKTVGCSSAAYKALFASDADKRAEKDKVFAGKLKKVKRLKEVIRTRIQEGYKQCLADYRIFAAIDLAYRAPFNQTTPTMIEHVWPRIQELLRKPGTQFKEVLTELENWGLRQSDLFLEVDVGGGAKRMIPNPPTFYKTLIPIVRAYTTIRKAKLFNERNVTPLLPYLPLKQVTEDEILCEIVTDLINSISVTYGYASVLRSAIEQMLKYGMVIAFTMEEWHHESQVIGGETVTTKEGLRYTLPHPSRTFYDLQHPLTTLNSDTGCEYVGHWHVLRYGDVRDNKAYWNRNKLTYGTNWLDSEFSGNYFRDIYPCQMSFPTLPESDTREGRQSMYTSADQDKAVFVTQLLMKITPSDWGLGDYDHKVWHRFIVAGDDAVIWAEPSAFVPAWFMGYDYEQLSAQQTSMGLELIPWQDHLGNALSQIILTAKQNLTNVVFYDTAIVDKNDIDTMINSGEMRYRATQYIPYDSLKNSRLGADVNKAFNRVELGQKDTSQMMGTISTILNLMERVLQISAQESGAAASHQQSKVEVEQTAGSSGQRVNLIGSSIDEGMDAWKRQNFEAARAYKDPEVSAQISSNIKDLETLLLKLGFAIDRRGDNKVVVKGHISKLRLEGFANTGSGARSVVDTQAAQAIWVCIDRLFQNPVMFQKIGADNVAKLCEHAAKLSGAPADFELPIDENAPPEDQMAQLQQQIAPMLQQAQQQTLEAVNKQIGEPVAKALAKQGAEINKMEETVKEFGKLAQAAEAALNTSNLKAQETQQKLHEQAVSFQQEMGQNQTRFEQEMQIAARKAGIEITLKEKKAEVDIETQKAKASATSAAKSVAAKKS